MAVTDDHGNASATWKLGTALGFLHTGWSRGVVGIRKPKPQQTGIQRTRRKPRPQDTIRGCCQPRCESNLAGVAGKEVKYPTSGFESWIVSEIRLKGCLVAWQVIAGQGEVQGSNHSDGSRWDYLSQVDPLESRITA